MNEAEDIQTRIYELEPIVELSKSAGWAVVLQHFNTVLRAIKEALVYEENLPNIMRLQERYRAFSSMLETVDSLYKERLELIERQEARQQEFDDL